jgi:DNA-binding Xre family transcriptional regulator
MSNNRTGPAVDRHGLSELVAEEIRAILARRGTSQRALAAEIGQPEHWLQRRIAHRRSVALTLEDVELIASGLGVEVGDLIRGAHLPTTP